MPTTVSLPHDITPVVGRIMASEPWARSVRIMDGPVGRNLAGTVWVAEVRSHPGATGAPLATGAVVLGDQGDPDTVGTLTWHFPADVTETLRTGWWAELMCLTWQQRWERFRITLNRPIARQS